MASRRVRLGVLVLSLSLFLLLSFGLKGKSPSVYAVMNSVLSQKSLLDSPIMGSISYASSDANSHSAGEHLAGSNPDGNGSNSSDLQVFGGALSDRRQWLKGLLHSRREAALPTVTAVNCSKIWANDKTELAAALEFQKSYVRQPKDIRRYLEETVNCTSYLLAKGFLLASVNDDELSFPLAFSVVVYKDLEQVERLLRAVYRPHNVYCVHHDNRSQDDFQSGLRLMAGCLPNVKIMERPVHVEWGKYSVLQADVECMRMLWRHPTKWRYFINLTGQEFPLKTNKEIVRILQTLNGANDISGTHDKLFNFRFEKFLPAPYNLTISKGCVHIIASRGYVDYVLNSRVGREFYSWVAPTFIPDEIYFSTLNHNPKLGVPGSYTGDAGRRQHFYRYKVWLYGVSNYTGVCDGKNVRYVCNFGLGDLPRLVVAAQLFANKFSYDFMPLAYDCLEEWYWHKVHLENVGRAQELNLTAYQTSDTVLKRYDGPVTIWE